MNARWLKLAKKKIKCIKLRLFFSYLLVIMWSFGGFVFKVLFIDLEVKCACKLILYNLLIVKSTTPGKVMINKGFPSLFVHTIY